MVRSCVVVVVVVVVCIEEMVVVSDVVVENDNEDEKEMVESDGMSPPWTYSHCRCLRRCCGGGTTCTNGFRVIFVIQFIFPFFWMNSRM